MKKLLILFLFGAVQNITAKPPMIVGLVPARNESAIIGQCLKALSLYTDAIIYLDDASTDNSVEVVQSLAQECNVAHIITKQTWYRDEPGDRNALLQAGRSVGGTHFIVIDADELLTSNCTDGNYLRNKILAMQPGDRMLLNWIQLWRSTQQYRYDQSPWTNNYKYFVFADDGLCSYSSEFIHTSRTPSNLNGNTHKIHGYDYGVMHFQFVNWRNLLVKQAWYRCLEHIRFPNKSVDEINKLYAPSKDETDLGVKNSPYNWFDAYTFFDPSIYAKPEQWREQQILGWFDEYGIEHFAGLDIWDINWGAGITQKKSRRLSNNFNFTFEWN